MDKTIDSLIIYLHNPVLNIGPSGHPTSCGWTIRVKHFKRSPEYPCAGGKMPWFVLFNSRWHRVKYKTGLPLYYIGKPNNTLARVSFAMQG